MVLARLDLDEASVDRFAEQIATILAYMEKLDQIDTTGVAPTSHAISLNNAFRKDTAEAHLERTRALSNSPENEDGHFIVPKVIP